jgi:hypothetical protein
MRLSWATVTELYYGGCKQPTVVQFRFLECSGWLDYPVRGQVTQLLATLIASTNPFDKLFNNIVTLSH